MSRQKRIIATSRNLQQLQQKVMLRKERSSCQKLKPHTENSTKKKCNAWHRLTWVYSFSITNKQQFVGNRVADAANQLSYSDSMMVQATCSFWRSAKHPPTLPSGLLSVARFANVMKKSPARPRCNKRIHKNTWTLLLNQKTNYKHRKRRHCHIESLG